MKYIYDKIRYFFLIICPIGPVLDSHILKFHFIYTTILGYLFWVCINLPLKIRKESYPMFLIISVYLVSIFINTLQYGWIDAYLYSIILIFLSSILVLTLLHNTKKSYLMIKYFVFGFFIITVLIYIYRLVILHSWNFYRVRGGASFYGGNEGHLIYLLFLFLAMEERNFYDATMAYLLGIANALLFTSKGGMIIQCIIGAYLLVRYLILNRFRIKIVYVVLSIVILACVIYVLASTEYGRILAFRFELYLARMKDGSTFLETRYPLHLEAWNYITSNLSSFIFGFGLGKYRYINIHHYTNCHNLLLDIWCTSGLIGFLVFFWIFAKSIINVRMKFLYIITLFFGVCEGNTLFFVNENDLWIWGWNYIMYMVIYYNSFKISHYNRR